MIYIINKLKIYNNYIFHYISKNVINFSRQNESYKLK